MEQHKDHQYIIALAKGDSKALETIYREHLPPVQRWIVKNSGTSEDARDIFQEAILALYDKSLDPDFTLTCPLGGFLFHVCRNKWISHLRKNKRKEEVIKTEQERYKEKWDFTPLVEQLEQEELRQTKLDKAFDQLSELCQKLLRFVAEGLDAAVIAQRLDMAKVSTFYRRKNACIDRWRTLYDNENA